MWRVLKFAAANQTFTARVPSTICRQSSLQPQAAEVRIWRLKCIGSTRTMAWLEWTTSSSPISWKHRDSDHGVRCRSKAVSIAHTQKKTLSKDMTIRKTSNLGSLIVRRLEKHGKFREKWCPERLEKPTETIGHRERAQTSERYFRKVATGHRCFQM